MTKRRASYCPYCGASLEVREFEGRDRGRTRGAVEPGPETTGARFRGVDALLASDDETRSVDLERVEAAVERLDGST